MSASMISGYICTMLLACLNTANHAIYLIRSEAWFEWKIQPCLELFDEMNCIRSDHWKFVWKTVWMFVLK